MNDVAENRRVKASRDTVAVKRRALEMGFDAVGVASLEPNAHADELDQWLDAGYAGTMTYLHRQAEKRKDPARIMPGARVAVVTLTNYFHGSTDAGRKPGVSGIPGLAPGVSGAVEVVRERDHRDLRAGHDAGGVLSLLGLSVQISHRARVPSVEPLIELVRVRVRLESGDPDRVEPQREPSTLHLEAVARRRCSTLLLDVFFHRCIVSRRHLAKRTTSSSGGTASSSP